MNPRTAAAPAVIIVLVLAGSCVTPRPALALEGSWVSSFHRTDDEASQDTWRGNLDLRTATDLPGGASLLLRGSLVYYNRNTRYGLDSGDGEFVQHRWYGDFRRSALRLRTQITPWQDMGLGSRDSRQRILQFDLNAAPANAPVLTAQYNRLDRITPGWTGTGIREGRSASDDWRGQLAYALGGVSSTVAYRHLESTPASGSLDAGTRTNDWRAALSASKAWRQVTLQSSYDAGYSTYAQRARDRKLYSQRVGATSQWNPWSKFTLGGSGTVEWGRTEDNALSGRRTRDERFFSGTADYRPATGVNLRVLREYRRQQQSEGEIVSDYLRGQATVSRDLFRGMQFQTGLQRSMDLASKGGSIPLNSVYGLLDGRLRQGLAARAELRASRAVIDGSRSGTQWARSLQLRANPVRTTSLSVSWRRDTLPKLDGESQTDQEWQYTVGYQPVARSSLIATYRRLSGTGRLTREERFGTMSASLRVFDGTTASVELSRRESLVLTSRTGEKIVGMDLGFWLPNEIRAKAQWRRIAHRDFLDPEHYQKASNSYGLTMDRSF